jgi:hypothetical protein
VALLVPPPAWVAAGAGFLAALRAMREPLLWLLALLRHFRAAADGKRARCREEQFLHFSS